MTRKDYELVAKIIRGMPDPKLTPDSMGYIAEAFAIGFKQADANFNRDKFLLRALGKGHNGNS